MKLKTMRSRSSCMVIGARKVPPVVAMALAIVVVGLPAFAQAYTDHCDTANLGCSGWQAWGLDASTALAGALYFDSACKRHDQCYRHGNMTYGKTREQCDHDFYVDTEEACLAWIVDPTCWASREIFYSFVRECGDGCGPIPSSWNAYPEKGCCEYDKRMVSVWPPRWETVPATTPMCGAIDQLLPALLFVLE